jgi:hypothetical protein
VPASATSCPTRTEDAAIAGKGDKAKKARKKAKDAAAATRAFAEALPPGDAGAVPDEAVDAAAEARAAGGHAAGDAGEAGAHRGRAVDAAAEARAALPVPRPAEAPPAPPPPGVVTDPARLCYGDAIREAGRTLIPVARVRVDGSAVEAVPLGVLDVGPAGVRFRAVPGTPRSERASRAGVAALAAIAAAVGAAALTRRRPDRRPWPARSRRR